MCEIALYVKVSRLLVLLGATKIGVTARNDPSLDHAIVTSGAYFRLRGTTSACKDYRSHNIQVTSEREADFEIGCFLLA